MIVQIHTLLLICISFCSHFNLSAVLIDNVLEKAIELMFIFCICIYNIDFLDTYLAFDLISFLLSIGQTAGRYEKTNEDITNVKQQVLGIKSTLIKMKGDLYADIAEVNKKVNAVQNILDSNLNKTGAISDEMAAFRTEIQRQAGEFKKYESVLNEEREERKALAKMLKNEQEKRKASEIKYFRLIVIIVILFIAWCVREKSMNSTQSSMEYKTNDTTSQSAVMADEDYGISVNDKLGMFDSSMSKIKSNFPEEDGRFWSSIFAPILRIIQEQYPSRPAVVLIATTRPYSAIAECLSREVASQIEILYELNDNSDNFLTLEATRLKSLDPEKAKSQFDKELSDNYRQRHMVAVIHDLGSLPASAATLLHAYCDHESAHFKKVVLLATVYLEPGIKPCTEEVEAYLAEVWQELEEDVLKPLISRVANNIAIMEDSGVSNYICRTWFWILCWHRQADIIPTTPLGFMSWIHGNCTWHFSADHFISIDD